MDLPIRLGVGVCTRERPKMFRSLLLDYLATQQIPDNTEVTFIFVENDQNLTIARICKEFKNALAERGNHPRIVIELEPVLGIAQARNRVLEIANHLELDYLATPDDDDYPSSENYLAELLDGIHTRKLDSAYGAYQTPPINRDNLDFFPKMVFAERTKGLYRAADRAIQHEKDGQLHRVITGGSNAIYRLEFLRKHNIKFNQTYGLGRAEDQEIWRKILAAGGKNGFVPKALLHERFRAERYTLKYMFNVRRSDAIIRYGKRYSDLSTSRLRGRILERQGMILGKLLSVIARLILVPLTGGKSIVGIAKSFGSLVGLIQGYSNRELQYYITTDGD